MTDIYNWPAVLRDAKRLFNDRTKAVVPEKEQKNYRTQNGLAKFTFGIQNNKVVCAWVGNFRKDRLGKPKKDSTRTIFSVADIIANFRYDVNQLAEGFTSREWDQIGKELLWLRGQLK